MFEPLHLATIDRIYPSQEGFYAIIISGIINELRKSNILLIINDLGPYLGFVVPLANHCI